MAEFSVTVNRMYQQAEELAGLNRRFCAAVQDLRQTENALNRMWEGAARETFHCAFGQGCVQMDKFSETISSYTISLQEICRRYQEAERRNLELASGRSW